jgi:hypothetical protein
LVEREQQIKKIVDIDSIENGVAMECKKTIEKLKENIIKRTDNIRENASS